MRVTCRNYFLSFNRGSFSRYTLIDMSCVCCIPRPWIIGKLVSSSSQLLVVHNVMLDLQDEVIHLLQLNLVIIVLGCQ